MSNELIKLQNLLKLNFKDTKILQTAFYHRSYLNEVKQDISSNERLEFLGDSVLSLVIAKFLFSKRSTDSEGDLTNLRAYIVKTKSLARAAKELNLGKYLHLSRGEEIGGGRQNPQLLANTYEALLGAIYVDCGFDTVQRVIKETLLTHFEKEITQGPPKDAKSSLQETVQERFKESPIYKILQTRGPDHAKQFVVAVYIKGKEMGRGKGASKQIAEEEAATQALQRLS